MPDEDLNDPEQPETPELETPETPEAPEAPAFDVETERERIRAEVRAEMEAQSRPAPDEEPDIDSLMFENPAAYRAALAKQIKGEFMAEVAPLLKRVNEDALTREIGAGLGQAGQDYLRKSLNGVPVDQMPPTLREMARLAAETVDRKSAPVRTAQERPYGSPSPTVEITDAERREYGVGTQYGPTEAELRAWKKEEMEASRR